MERSHIPIHRLLEVTPSVDRGAQAAMIAFLVVAGVVWVGYIMIDNADSLLAALRGLLKFAIFATAGTVVMVMAGLLLVIVLVVGRFFQV